MSVLGIDPGSVSAAYGVLSEDGHFKACGDIPVADKMIDPHGWADVVQRTMPIETVIEQVGAMPKQGVASSFRFGMGTGIIRGVVQGLGYPLVQVVPGKWKKHFGLDSDAEKSRALALRLWPLAAPHLRHKKDHGRAEALLIAKWRLETRK